jgi:hypothetical protein
MSNLRVFKDCDDLFDSVENEEILEWVNAYAKIAPQFEKLNHAEEKRRGYHKVYQERRKLIMSALTERLDPDELKRLKDEAESRVAEREEEG